MGMPQSTQASTTPTKKTSRFSRPRSSNTARPSVKARISVTTTAKALVDVFQSKSRNSRSTANMPISTTPTGSAAARQALEMSSAGVVMKRSSDAYSQAGHATIARKASAAYSAIASASRRRCGGSLDTIAVMRMCSPRRRATTAPSIASQMKSMEASSSDQISGWCSTKRATTPASSTATSASTSAAARPSTSTPSTCSVREVKDAGFASLAASPWPCELTGGALPLAPPVGGSGGRAAGRGALMPACPCCVPGVPRLHRRTSTSTRRRSRPCAAGRGRRRGRAG